MSPVRVADVRPQFVGFAAAPLCTPSPDRFFRHPSRVGGGEEVASFKSNTIASPPLYAAPPSPPKPAFPCFDEAAAARTHYGRGGMTSPVRQR